MSATDVKGLLAVLSLEFEPAGVVMGAGVYQIYRPGGCRGIGPKTSAEPLIYPTYEGALRDAWRSVIARLQEEAVKA